MVAPAAARLVSAGWAEPVAWVARVAARKLSGGARSAAEPTSGHDLVDRDLARSWPRRIRFTDGSTQQAARKLSGGARSAAEPTSGHDLVDRDLARSWPRRQKHCAAPSIFIDTQGQRLAACRTGVQDLAGQQNIAFKRRQPDFQKHCAAPSIFIDTQGQRLAACRTGVQDLAGQQNAARSKSGQAIST